MIEGGGHAAGVAALGLEGDLFIEQGGFDGPGAALAPAGGAHFLNQAEFDFVHRAEVVDMLLQEIQEVLALFVFENDAVGAEAVTESV